MEPQQYILMQRENVTTQVEVRKTSTGNKLRFQPLRLFLRSSCAGDEENPITVSAEVWNYQGADGSKYIRFTPPCPAIMWAGRVSKERRLVFNKQTLDGLNSMIDMSIFNEGYADRKLFDRSILNDSAPTEEKRLERTVLLYQRSMDRGSWEKGLLADGTQVDFAAQGVEDELGYAKVFWDVSGIVDSTYKIKVQSQCTDLGVSDDRAYDTEPIEFILDRIPPAIYGKPQVKLIGPASVVQDEEFGFSFKEPLFCDDPYTFDLEVTLSKEGNVQTLSHGNGLHVKCLATDIRYRFDDQALEGFTSNTTVALALSGVQDLAGNQMETYSETFSWNQKETNQAASVVQTGNTTAIQCVATQHAERPNLGCDGLDNDCDGEIDECDEDQIPPKLSFKDGLAVDALEDDEGLVTINTPTFKSISEAQSYLASILVAEDDCMVDLPLSVTPPSLGASCQSTIFKVTATSTQCPDQTVTRQYQMTVDTDVPVITAGFNLGQGHVNDFSSVGDEGAYLGIVSGATVATSFSCLLDLPLRYQASSNATDYEYVGFSYTVTVRRLMTP